MDRLAAFCKEEGEDVEHDKKDRGIGSEWNVSFALANDSVYF